MVLRNFVVVFMIPDEGEYAIPKYRSTNGAIDHRIPIASGEVGRSTMPWLVELFASESGWDPRLMTTEELRLWVQVDPTNSAICAINRLEGKDERFGLEKSLVEGQ